MPWPSFLVSPIRLLSPQPLGSGGYVQTPQGPVETIPLSDLALGQCGLVHDLEVGENDDKRLRALGICPGRRVWMVRRGDPMVLKVMGTRLGLATELAKQVTVEVCTSACPVSPVEPASDAAGEGSA